MNGRNFEYRVCNEQTLVKRVGTSIRFVTFWKNVHQQFLISVGTIKGCTYEVYNSREVTKDEGNEQYINYRKNGYVKFKDSKISFMSKWLGEVLY